MTHGCLCISVWYLNLKKQAIFWRKGVCSCTLLRVLTAAYLSAALGELQKSCNTAGRHTFKMRLMQ